ncbi:MULTISPECIES: GntR family transcriptional regulator [unclassified Bacillus (in: firmicutes)]|uniref:GntR family transcriptional regulator n=1 Tax=unclassified Bacillus (in: firmicutes) TaxID=185979 RepID=UPI0008F214A2|nr:MULTISPECIES: GntR family transcriptional regulator [unclassified Bacillus (in: firmicutes)]SFA73253.1 transcriptional regulator, GntR family [Bacillus sp. UNCCL13]SFQ63369.1 transcriptional regulator, GntR family [Bacillus sp. cl95]
MSIKSDNRHLYLQVIDRLKQDIEEGIYKEREKLPSEFDLAKHLGVSRATLREALRILEEENVIIRRHGVGTFVSAKPLFTSGIEQLNSVTNMIKQAGMKPGTIFLSSLTQGPTEEDIRRFTCSADDDIVVLERVRTANGEPVVYCVDKIPVNILPETFSHDEESILNILEGEANRRITYAVAQIEPIGYHEKISPILECEPETALLVLKQMHFDEMDEPILYSVNYFKADKFSFHVLRKRI